MVTKRIGPVSRAAAIVVLALAGIVEAQVAPADSAIGRGDPSLQRLLISTCETGSNIKPGVWRMSSAAVSTAQQSIDPKVGAVALRFAAIAEAGGTKGDFEVTGSLPGDCRRLGMWVYLEPQANVARLGFQFYDGEDESLFKMVDADWTGWKWIELDLQQPVAQANAQPDKNGKVDQPIKSVHVAWFSKEAGPSSIIVDGVVAQTQLPAQSDTPMKVEMLGGGGMEPGRPSVSAAITNFREQAETATIEYSLQRDATMFEPAADQAPAIPSVGEVLAQSTITRVVPARSFALADFKIDRALSPGAYLLATRTNIGGQAQMLYRHLYVMPPAMPNVSAASRFGLNVSNLAYAPINRRLGVGWVRFENLKWPFVSQEAGVYRYDGGVGANINHDQIFEGFRANGLSITPYLFMTPPYQRAADAPAGAKGATHPPANLASYGEFVFQTVARYGSVKHPAAALKTPDKKSGLGLIGVYEMWNEPNLNDPGWGHWVDTLDHYLDMFRIGAEAAKRADPSAKVTNGGYAGISIPLMDRLRSYTYPDGKRPVDFIDILNVHHYCGQSPPELATVDTNVDRSGAKVGRRTYEQDLKQLFRWRDKHAPGKPVWLTETGYDTGGPKAVGERMQAAWMVRDIMLALAGGMDKVLVYREAGSSPVFYGASGVLNNGGALRPSWFTYATLIRQLDGVTEGIQLPCEDANVRLYAWKRGEQTVLSAWAVKGQAKLPLKLGRSSVTDAFGHTDAPRDVEALSLTEFPIYISEMADMTAVKSLQQQARKLEAEDAARRDRLARAPAYLIDFGSRDSVGMIEVGDDRLCTPVIAADTWDAAKGYGFEPKAALMDEVAPWSRDLLDRDAVRINGAMHFRLKVAPGQYQLRMGINPKSKNARLIVRGATGGEQTFDIAKDGTIVQADLVVAGADQSLTFVADGYLSLKWLTLIGTRAARPGDSTE